MAEKIKVRYDGNENCKHVWANEKPNYSSEQVMRICRICGRCEKVEIISEYEESYKKFHGQ